MQVLDPPGPAAPLAAAADDQDSGVARAAVLEPAPNGRPAPRGGPSPQDDESLLRDMDASHEDVCRAQRGFFTLIAEADRRSLWEGTGAHDMAHWLRMRYGISDWKARRWIAAAHALGSLPATSEAFSSGRLGVDKVVELTRFATPETESGLLGWAERVAAGTIRQKGNECARQSGTATRDLQSDRSFDWWLDPDGHQLLFEGRLPAAEGRVVVSAVERMLARLPKTPDGEESPTPAQRRADALVAICSARVGTDPDPDRATVVIHVPAEMLWGEDAVRARASGSPRDPLPPRGEGARGGEPNCGLEGGGVVPAATARRLACDARIETVLTGPGGWVKGLGRSSRDPSPQMLRALRRRDGGCRFPGCGTLCYTKAHHIRWWGRLGRTDMDNLVLLCSFHHTLVHEGGWSLTLRPDNTVRFYSPDGRRYRAGPGPPRNEAP